MIRILLKQHSRNNYSYYPSSPQRPSHELLVPRKRYLFARSEHPNTNPGFRSYLHSPATPQPTPHMKLLVTGCNGSVGQRVVRLALNRGYIVTGVDLTPLSEQLKQLIEHKKDTFTFHQIDLKDYDRVLEILQTSNCEAVIHLAALRDPTDYKVQTHNRFGAKRSRCVDS